MINLPIYNNKFTWYFHKNKHILFFTMQNYKEFARRVKPAILIKFAFKLQARV